MARKSQVGSDGPASPPHPKPLRIGVVARLRAYFFAGMLVTAPIAITLYLSWLFITFIDSRVSRLLPASYNPELYLPFTVPGIGVLVVFAVLTLIGAFTAGYFGRLLVRFSEAILARMPVVRSVYGATKQIFETVLAKQSTAFREVALIQYPRPGIWTLCFITGTTGGEVEGRLDQPHYNVFVPTTPNPTGGFLLFVPKADVRVLDMSVEDGLKMILSVGIISPADRRLMGDRPPEVLSTAAAPPLAAPGGQPDLR